MTRNDTGRDDDSPTFSRRQLIAMSSGAAIGLAGCTGDGDEGTPEGTPTPTPSPTETEVGEMGMADTETPTPTATEKGKGREVTETEQKSTATPTAAQDDPYPNPDGEILDTTLNVPHDSSWNPTEWNPNSFASNSNNPFPWEFELYIHGSNPAVNGTVPLIALDDFQLKNGGCEVVWTMREGDHWWDGTPVTNRDWLTHQRIQQYQQFGPDINKKTKNSPRYTGPELEIEGDKVIRFNRRQPINRGRALLNAGYYWRVKHDYYKDWLEQFQDATTIDENDSITQELVEHQISFEKFAESLGNGLWKPVNWSEISVTFEKHEGHARSGWTNIPQSKIRMMPDTQKRVEAYKSGQFDLGVSAQDPISNIMGQIPDMNMVREFPYFYYRNVRFNFRDEFHTSRRGVRRAFAYMLNQKGLRDTQMSANGYRTFPILQNGMAIGVSRTFLGREFNNQLIDYGFEPKPDKAAAELEGEGYSKQKDRWISPNGEPLVISVMSGPEPREKVSVQYMASQLSRNGITVEPQFVSGTNQWIAIAEQYQNIPGAMRQFGGGPHPSIPYVNWWAQVVELPGQVAEQPPLRSVEECGGGGEVETPTLKLDRTPRWKRPVRPEYPVEVGDPADPGETESQTLYPIKWDREIERTQSLERVKELARKLAWYQNWQVTDVQYYTESWSQAGDTVNFFWGDGSFDEDWIREPYSLWVQGLIQGRTKPYNGKPEGPIKPDAKSRAEWRGPENGG